MKRQLTACCIALACIGVAASSFAAAPVAKIQALLAKPKTLCGRFDQSKQLAGMKKPLLSNGRFCVVAGKGVVWRTLQPFPNTLRLTRDEITHLQGDHVTLRIDARQEPVVRMINGVLFSLLAGDLAQLDTVFDSEGSVQGQQWSVGLKPREAGLARVISGIALEGDAYVNKVVIGEANGDRTSISFSAMQAGDAAMTPEEAALF